MNTLRITLIRIDPHEEVTGPHEIDDAKVSRFMQMLLGGEQFPPVRLVYYDGITVAPFYQIIDGHHRVAACQSVEHSFDAMVAQGDEFEQLDMDLRTAGDGKRADDIEFWVIPEPESVD